jgi:hypothetical protein
MKKIFIILIITFSSVLSTKADAQPYGVPDTLAYLQSIVANKAQFVGQPFSVLQDSLKIQIKFFSPFARIPHDKTKETSTSFSFYFPQTAEEIYLTYPALEIYWQPYLNANQSHSLYNFNDGGSWSTSVADFYANAIIADIKIVE